MVNAPSLHLGARLRVLGYEYHCSMRVPVALRSLPGRGLGVVALEDLPKGTEVFREADVMEDEFTPEEAEVMLAALPSTEARRLALDHSRSTATMFYWCRDTASFFNHDNENNVEAIGNPGEEVEGLCLRRLECEWLRILALAPLARWSSGWLEVTRLVAVAC